MFDLFLDYLFTHSFLFTLVDKLSEMGELKYFTRPIVLLLSILIAFLLPMNLIFGFDVGHNLIQWQTCNEVIIEARGHEKKLSQMILRMVVNESIQGRQINMHPSSKCLSMATNLSTRNRNFQLEDCSLCDAIRGLWGDLHSFHFLDHYKNSRMALTFHDN